MAPRGRSGFTLMEVLVAMTILAVGIVGVVAALGQSVRAASSASHLEEAVEIAQNQLALAVRARADALAGGSGTTLRYRWSLGYAQKPHELSVASVTVEWLDHGQMQAYTLSQVFRPGR